VTCSVLPGHAESSKRVALLIGNAAYSVGRLANPPNDVRQMEDALKAVGFSVQILLNGNQNAMKRAVRDFGNSAQGAAVAFLYYSGHGAQVNGENYLIPVQATIDKESDYSIEAVSANEIMRQISGARPRAAVVVLDACRDNPLAATTRSTSKGLGRMDAPTGTMIAFATAPNTTATDEGIYARTLAKQIRTPGLELLDIFRNTTAEVVRATSGKQEPRISEMSITERVFFLEAPERGSTASGIQVASVRPEVATPSASQQSFTDPAQTSSGFSPEIAARYQVNSEDGTVVDVVKKLQWMRCTEGQTWDGKTCTGKGIRVNWKEVQSRALKSFAGHSDWRLPTAEELKTLVFCSSGKPKLWNDTGGDCDKSSQAPTIPRDVFPNTINGFYWTSSSFAVFSDERWLVSFESGGADGYSSGSEAAIRYVRALR